MTVMHSIENNTSNQKMKFDEIFKPLLVSENYFFDKTKMNYETDEIILLEELIVDIKKKLETNCWFKYFSIHSKEIRTWIDFEQKIEEALILVAKLLNNIEEKYLAKGRFDLDILTLQDSSSYYLSELDFQLLKCLAIIRPTYDVTNTSYKSGKLSQHFFVVEREEKFGFDSRKFLAFLQRELNNFIDLFNTYLTEIIGKLKPKNSFHFVQSNNIDKVFSFNYTQTYENFYKRNVDIEYLHGKSGSNQNLVLGISDIYSPPLLKLKVYGFTKYHQKLLKDTQYIFLNDLILQYKELHSKLINAKSELKLKFSLSEERDFITKIINKLNSEIKNFKLNIFIWGHSLDVSDEVYINEIFSLNEDRDDNVRVTIYHYDYNAKFELLANLIHILKKDKVEKWMKNKWLIFNENPHIKQQS